MRWNVLTSLLPDLWVLICDVHKQLIVCVGGKGFGEVSGMENTRHALNQLTNSPHPHYYEIHDNGHCEQHNQ